MPRLSLADVLNAAQAVLDQDPVTVSPVSPVSPDPSPDPSSDPSPDPSPDSSPDHSPDPSPDSSPGTSPDADPPSYNAIKDDKVTMLTGKKYGKQIKLNGYRYSKDQVITLKSGLQKIYWQCTERRRLKCSARLHTSASEPYEVLKEPSHSHVEDQCNMKIETLRSRVREEAASSYQPTANIVASALTTADDETMSNCPGVEQLKRTARLARKRVNSHPVCPKSATFDIPDEFKFDDRGRDFLLAGT